MVVRDLVALLGVKTDMKSFKKANSALDNVKKLVGSLGVAFGALEAVRWAKNAILEASAVNENMNVMAISFREASAEVENWAKTFGDAAGRSKFELMAMAGRFGSVLNPALEGNAAETAKMSQGLAELAVDLASVFNTSEDEAFTSLRAAMIGSTEPMLKFGVNAQVANLQTFALSKGIKKTVQTMTNAEKTQLRFAFIMDQTKNAQGDAIKTGKGFANISKALGAKAKDLAIAFGLRLLPTLEKLIPMLVSGVRKIEPFVSVLGTLFATVIKIAVWVAKLVSNLPTPAKIILISAAFLKWGKALGLMNPWLIVLTALVLVIEDLLVWMDGGNSVIGKWLESLGDIAGIPVAEYVRNILRWFKLLAESPVDAFESIIGSFADFFSELGDGILRVIDRAVRGVKDLLSSLWNGIPTDLQIVIESILQYWTGIFDILTSPFILFINFIKDIFSVGFEGALRNLFDSTVQWAKDIFAEIWEPIRKVTGVVGRLFGITNGETSTGIKQPGGVDPGSSTGIGLRGFDVMTKQGIKSSLAKSTPGAGIQNNNQAVINMTINAQGNQDHKKLGSEVHKAATEALKRQNRNVMKTLVPQPVGG